MLKSHDSQGTSQFQMEVCVFISSCWAYGFDVITWTRFVGFLFGAIFHRKCRSILLKHFKRKKKCKNRELKAWHSISLVGCISG